MALAGFKITNHPQQTRLRGADDTVDERITPADLFAEYDARFHFTLDAAANAKNAKCAKFFSLERSGLDHSWGPERVWCNPPYSNLGGFVRKAHYEFQLNCPVIVMLLPANRTEQRWWQESVEPLRDRPGGFLRTEFIARRRNFGVPGNEGGKFHSSPPFGLVALIWS